MSRKLYQISDNICLYEMEFSLNNGQKHEFQMRKRALLFYHIEIIAKKGKRMEHVCLRVVICMDVKLNLFYSAGMARNKTEERDYI